MGRTHLDNSFSLHTVLAEAAQVGLQNALPRWFTHMGNKLSAGCFFLYGVTCSLSFLGFRSKNPKRQNMEDVSFLKSELINWPKVTNVLLYCSISYEDQIPGEGTSTS